jgi:hypothetical protein
LRISLAYVGCGFIPATKQLVVWERPHIERLTAIVTWLSQRPADAEADTIGP